jgi:hypothetical protein
LSSLKGHFFFIWKGRGVKNLLYVSNQANPLKHYPFYLMLALLCALLIACGTPVGQTLPEPSQPTENNEPVTAPGTPSETDTSNTDPTTPTDTTPTPGAVQPRLIVESLGQEQALEQASVSNSVNVKLLSDGSIDSVDFLLNPADPKGVQQLAANHEPALTVDTTTLPNGTHTLLAVAYDAEGTILSETLATFTVVNDGLASDLSATSIPVTAVRAKRADDFVGSIGVNLHLHYTDKVYKYYNEIVKPRLLELGIRHARDKAYTYSAANANTFYYQRLRDLGANGIRFNLLVSPANRYGPATDLSKLDDIYEWSGRSVISYEGANEPDIIGLNDWLNITVDLQKKLWQAVNSRPSLNKVSVLGPSVVWKPETLGNLSSYLDYGNWHPYPGGKCPTCKDVYGTNMDKLLPRYRLPSGSKRMVVTETGYHNALNISGTEGHKPVSELAAGKYMPRLYLEYFNRGFVRTYAYEFLDLAPNPDLNKKDANFGLIRNNGTPKPAFYALKNMIGLLEDPGSSFTPGVLSYGLTGSTSNVRTTLLQKRDGRFYLALWVETSSWDTGMRANAPDDVSARSDLTVAPQPLTLTLSKTFSNVKFHTLNSDGSMTTRQQSAGNSFTLNANDTVMFIELTP